MGTNCAPLVADLILFCYERYFMLSLSDNNQLNKPIPLILKPPFLKNDIVSSEFMINGVILIL